MDCGAAWQLLVDQLPDDWPLLAIDWPGYGHSDRHSAHYWFPEHLAELDWLLGRSLARQIPARIVGHSMGGTVASMYAGVRPERVAWLVNLEGYGMPELPPAELPPLISGWLDGLRTPPLARRYQDLEELAVALRRANQLPAALPRALSGRRSGRGRSTADMKCSPIRASRCARRCATRAPSSRRAGRGCVRRSCCCTAANPGTRDACWTPTRRCGCARACRG